MWTPESPPRAAILVIQEIFGVGAYIRAVAERLADAGYLVGAPDLFWRFAPNWEAITPRAGLQRVVREGAAARLSQGGRRLHRRARAPAAANQASTAQPAVIGFCLGGTLAWSVAVNGEPSCCVSYYGSGVPSMIGMIDQVSCPTLFHFGNNDPYIPNEGVDEVGCGACRPSGFRAQRRERRARVRQPRERRCSTTKPRPTRRGRRRWPSSHRTFPHESARAPTGPRLADGLVTHLERTPVDVDVATKQWHGYVDALQHARLGDRSGDPGRRLPGLGLHRGHRRDVRRPRGDLSPGRAQPRTRDGSR